MLILAAAGSALLAVTITVRGDDDLPKRPELARYEPMMNRSPFAVATAVAAPAPTANFAKDLYVANAAHSPNGDLVTVASSTDKNLKLYLTTEQPVDGYSISNIQWSEEVGETKVTIMKNGEFATIGFNEALLRAGISANATAPGMQQPMVPPPQNPQNFQGGQAFTGQNPGSIKPAPIPMLPSPPPRMRAVIPRVPQRQAPAPEPEEEEEETIDE